MGNEYSQETLFLALTVAGVVLPWVVQAVKRGFGLSGRAAAWATFGVALFGALAAGAVTGQLFAPVPGGEPIEVISTILERTMWVFGLATLVYKTLKGRAGLSGSNGG